MIPPQPARSFPWWLPWCLSITLHAALALVFSLIPNAGTPGNGVIDTRMSSPPAMDAAIHVSMIDDPPRVPERLFQISQVAPPLPVVPTVTPPKPTASTIAPIQQVAARKPDEGNPRSDSTDHGGRGGAGGSGVATVFFEAPARGHSVVYVLDRSISMGLNGALGLVKTELLRSLAQLPPQARFQVVFFNRTAETVHVDGQVTLLPASATNKQRVAGQLESLRAEGGTDHLPALKLALSLAPDVIYFLTDGNDLTPEHIRAVTQLNHGRSLIHTIDFGSTEHGPMQALAAANRGMWRKP